MAKRMVRVRCCTWNVCGLDVCDLSEGDRTRLDECLSSCLPRYSGEPADVICVGIVEILELSAGNVVRDSFVANSEYRTSRVTTWREALSLRLPDYELICDSGLVGVALFCFARGGVLSNAESCVVSTGLLGGSLGNKGVCVSRLSFARSAKTLTVVHSHLSSDPDKLDQRNAGQQKGANFSTSKAHISASFHSFQPTFGRVIISPQVLVRWMFFFLTELIAKHSSRSDIEAPFCCPGATPSSRRSARRS